MDVEARGQAGLVALGHDLELLLEGLQVVVEDLDRLLEEDRAVEEGHDLVAEHVLGHRHPVLGQVQAGPAHLDRPGGPAPVEDDPADDQGGPVVVGQAELDLVGLPVHREVERAEEGSRR